MVSRAKRGCRRTLDDSEGACSLSIKSGRASEPRCGDALRQDRSATCSISLVMPYGSSGGGEKVWLIGWACAAPTHDRKVAEADVEERVDMRGDVKLDQDDAVHREEQSELAVSRSQAPVTHIARVLLALGGVAVALDELGAHSLQRSPMPRHERVEEAVDAMPADLDEQTHVADVLEHRAADLHGVTEAEAVRLGERAQRFERRIAALSLEGRLRRQEVGECADCRSVAPSCRSAPSCRFGVLAGTASRVRARSQRPVRVRASSSS